MCGNGQGSPCLDLRRVPDTLADATVGADLVVVEGMGRAIHTNYRCAPRAAARPRAAPRARPCTARPRPGPACQRRAPVAVAEGQSARQAGAAAPGGVIAWLHGVRDSWHDFAGEGCTTAGAVTGAVSLQLHLGSQHERGWCSRGGKLTCLACGWCPAHGKASADQPLALASLLRLTGCLGQASDRQHRCVSNCSHVWLRSSLALERSRAGEPAWRAPLAER